MTQKRENHIVFIKDEESKDITLIGSYTNKTVAWQVRDSYSNEGILATCISIPQNEEQNILLSIFSKSIVRDK